MRDGQGKNTYLVIIKILDRKKKKPWRWKVDC